MKIIPICAFIDNYIWLIINNSKTICVDPGESKPVINYLLDFNLTLSDILVTHHHYDHVDGLTELAKIYPNVNIYANSDPRINATKFVHTNDCIEINQLNFKIIATPGHTSSHVCFFEMSNHLLFCGDTLFSGGCGRVFEGTHEELLHSLEKIALLPLDTKIYCGHEYTLKNLKFASLIEPDNQDIKNHLNFIEKKQVSLPSTLELEKKINPFLRLDKPEITRYVEKNIGSCDQLTAFKFLRELKDKF